MFFKKEKIKRSQLDQLSRTMSVIPMSELMLMMGELGPGYYSANNFMELASMLSNHVMDSSYVEAVYYHFPDGTYGIYIHPDNTDFRGHVGGNEDSSGQYSIYGKYFDSWGHTHIYNSMPTDPQDYSTKNKIGLPTSIYYQGIFYGF